jgi:phospholipid/cholesterol/gamma-HCH transport system substrate-binding protein
VEKAAASFGQTARRLNDKDGPMDRLAEGTQALSHAADSFNSAPLPRINRVTEETSRAVRQLSRAATAISDNPQSLIFGAGPVNPGPGEPGFVAPGEGK